MRDEETIASLLRERLEHDDASGVLSVLLGLRPEDIAAILREVGDEEVEQTIQILDASSPELAGQVLPFLDRHDLARVLAHLPAERVIALLAEFSVDDATWALELMDEERRQAIVSAMHGAEAREIRERLEYPEGSAGRLMGEEFLALPEADTAGSAIRHLQEAGEDVTIIYVYLLDPAGRLSGVVSLRQLLRVPPDRRLRSLSPAEVISVNVNDDQEQVARVFARYDFVCLPVVDEQGRLAGIVTHDDVIDVVSEEATEDMLHMAGTTPDDVIAQSVWRSARVRAPWLFFSLLGGIGAMKILDHQERHLGELFVALALFVPVIVGMGGNLGTQAATIMVRGLATGRVRRHDALPVLWRELRTALLMGSFYGLLLLSAAWLFLNEPLAFCLVVGAALVASMLMASAFGTLMPIVLHGLGVDPAVATGPFVTTTMDILGILTYLTLAGLVLDRGGA